jgi:endogenous inhibitor of DNA gyrase (YacG/DUF329 family)
MVSTCYTETMSGTCPICHKAVPPRAKSEFFPFCSVRCKTIDLAKWMGGDYRVATEECGAERSAPSTTGVWGAELPNETQPPNENINAPAAGNRKEMPS